MLPTHINGQHCCSMSAGQLQLWCKFSSRWRHVARGRNLSVVSCMLSSRSGPHAPLRRLTTVWACKPLYPCVPACGLTRALRAPRSRRARRACGQPGLGVRPRHAQAAGRPHQLRQHGEQELGGQGTGDGESGLTRSRAGTCVDACRGAGGAGGVWVGMREDSGDLARDAQVGG